MATIIAHKTLFLLFLISAQQLIFSSTGLCAAAEARIEFVPAESTHYGVMDNDTISSRRRLAPFQLCLLCRCCPANSLPADCLSMPCCFGIDCQLPDKPFGTCAFVPKSCNCTSCVM